MYGTESKPKNDKSSSSSSSSSPRSSSRAVVTVTHAEDVAESTSVVPLIEFMLISMPNIPSELVLLILSYGTPNLLTTSPDPKQFFINVPRCTLFYDDVYFNLAMMDQHCIWGRPEEFKKKLEEVKIKSKEKSDPSLLTRLFTTIIDGEDHRGPGFIPSGTLLQRSIYVGDVLNEDEKSRETMVSTEGIYVLKRCGGEIKRELETVIRVTERETMASMVGRYVIEICGEDEFKRQLEPVLRVMEEEDKKKAAIEAGDREALNKVWNILKNADELTLESNAELKTELTEYENQLRKPGNEKIIQEIEKLFDGDYYKLGGYRSSKNNFAKNRIMGLAQLRRLSASDLQLSFPGIAGSLENKVIAERIDIRSELGVIPGGRGTYLLGSNCHLDICQSFCRTVAEPSPREEGGPGAWVAWRMYNEKKHCAIKKLCSDWTPHQSASPRF